MSLEKRALSKDDRPKAFNRVSRDTVRAVLVMSNAVQITGTLHVPPGARLTDLFNLQPDKFVAVTDATLVSEAETYQLSFVAVNKSHVVTAVELD